MRWFKGKKAQGGFWATVGLMLLLPGVLLLLIKFGIGGTITAVLFANPILFLIILIVGMMFIMGGGRKR